MGHHGIDGRRKPGCAPDAPGALGGREHGRRHRLRHDRGDVSGQPGQHGHTGRGDPASEFQRFISRDHECWARLLGQRTTPRAARSVRYGHQHNHNDGAQLDLATSVAYTGADFSVATTTPTGIAELAVNGSADAPYTFAHTDVRALADTSAAVRTDQWPAELTTFVDGQLHDVRQQNVAAHDFKHGRALSVLE